MHHQMRCNKYYKKSKLTLEDMGELPGNYDEIAKGNLTTLYGWQWESRFADAGNVTGIVEWVALVAGMEKGKFLPWVMRIAHNATIDHIRKHKRFVDVNAHVDEPDGSDFYDRLPDASIISADDMMAIDQTKESLLKHIANLPDEQKQVVMMRHYYEMSFKEIAEITDVSINTALGRMRYAIINLRKLVEKYNIQLQIN